MLLRPIQGIVFKFIRISVDGEIIENDTKTIVWTENILSGVVWTGPFLSVLNVLITASENKKNVIIILKKKINYNRNKSLINRK